MRPLTFTTTRTRTEAVVDQVDMFLQYALLRAAAREKILKAVENRWIESAGVFLADQKGRLVEAEISVDWTAHAHLASLTPVITTDLPGWEDRAAPEVRSVGRRFGATSRDLAITPRYWVRFTAEIRNAPERYKRLCREVGVDPNASPPPWAGPVSERAYALLDLPETQAAMRQIAEDDCPPGAPAPRRRD